MKLFSTGESKKVIMSLEEAARFHGHLCPMLALGYRMGKLALKKLGRAREGGMKLLAVVEFQNCLADGIAFVTGATFGKSTLILKPLGKFAASFYDLASGKSLRILVRKEILEATLDYGRRGEEIKNMPVAERKQAAEEHMRRGKEIVAKLMEKSDEELFEIKEAPPFKQEPYPSLAHAYCSNCGELVLKAYAEERRGEVVCRACVANPQK
jgi:formylmethanofuran dehydrogenase subunit E